MSKTPAGLYIHIPFCAKKCDYCDFYSVCAPWPVIDGFCDALIADLEKNAAEYFGMKFDTVFIGGGTPSVIGGRLVDIIRCVLKNFVVLTGGEITVEVNPESADIGLLRALKSVGVNRISVGAQSFDNRQLKLLGRIHDRDKIFSAVDSIVSAGFSNYNLDIMFGLPRYADDDIDFAAVFRETVDSLISISPPHISAYSLTVAKGTALFENTGKYAFCDEEDESAAYQHLCKALCDKGYEHYEISNFAREGFECRHNLKYWTGVEYVGIGPGAHSFVNGVRYAMPCDLDEYCRGNIGREILERVDDGERSYERLVFGLRTKRGVEFAQLKEYFDITRLNKCIMDFEKNNFMTSTALGFALTEKGFWVSNHIIGLLADCMKK